MPDGAPHPYPKSKQQQRGALSVNPMNDMHKIRAESALAYLFLTLIASAGVFYILVLPAIVSTLVDGLGFTEQQAGYVSSANAYGSMTGAIVAVFLVRHVSWRKAVAYMFVLMIAMELASTQIASPELMTFWRYVSGAVGGCSVGFGLSLLARLKQPDRAFGFLVVVQFGIGGLLILLRPYVTPYLGVTGIFVMLALLMVLSLSFIPFLDAYPPKSPTSAGKFRLPPLTVFTVLTLFGVFFYQAAGNGMWTFVERVGIALQLDSLHVSQAVAFATWGGCAGGFVPILLGNSMGRMRLIVIGIVMTIAGVGLIHFSDGLVSFTIGGAIINFAWSFVIAYLLGLTAHFDASGQLTALAGTASKFGLATGPLIATMLIANGTYGPMLFAATIGYTMALVVAIVPARHADRT